MEQWKSLVYDKVTYPDYEISNLGRARSIDRYVDTVLRGSYFIAGRMLTFRHNKKNPHLFFDIRITDEEGNRIQKTIYVHKAVYNTFVGDESEYSKDEKVYVTHDDRDVTHNYPHNLKPITHSELQIRNMKEHPEARNRLAKNNRKSGHYKKMKEQLSHSDETIALIKKLHKEGKTIHEIAVTAHVSYSSVSKYK